MADAADRSKRQREAPPESDDLMFKARIIMHEDPFKERAPIGEDKQFRALFGCSSDIALILWCFLRDKKLIPAGGSIMQYLWTLLFMKVYPTEDNMKLLTRGTDQKTIRKWVWQFMKAIAETCEYLVS